MTLDSFFKDAPYTRVVGTYIYPHRLLGEPDWSDVYSVTEIVATAATTLGLVLITRNGGLFIEPPASFSDPYGSETDEPSNDFQEKLEYLDAVSEVFNHLICEFALHGVVSMPVSPVQISRGKLVDNHALVVVASGGRELYLENTLGPSVSLIRGDWRFLPIIDYSQVSECAALNHVPTLLQVSANLPTLIAGAYSQYSRHQLAEALIDSWIVIEQIINWWWTRYVSQFSGKRKQRLKNDTRTYTAAVRAEILAVAGQLNRNLYDEINTARHHRNNLAHGAEIKLDGATQAVKAMKSTVETVLATTVESPTVSRGIDW